MGSSTRQSSNTTRPHIWLVVQSSFSKLCFQSPAIVSMVSHALLIQDRLYLWTHSKMNHIYLTKDQKFSILSGHSQSIQLDKSYSITSNTVVIKSSRIFARSAYKCTKMSPWFCHAGATRNPSATILFYSIYIKSQNQTFDGFCILEYESAFLFCNEANQMYIPSFSSDSNAMTCFDVMISCHDDKLICR